MAGIDQISFTSPYAAEEMAIQRRQKLAEQLAKNASAPLPTEMVGGWAVKRSPLEGLARVAQAGTSAYLTKQAEDKQRELVKQLQGDAGKWVGSQPQGTPAQIQDTTQEGTGSFDMSGMAGPQNTPAQPPSQQAVMGHLMQGLQNPMTAPIAQARLAQVIKQDDPYTLPEGGIRMGPNGPIYENKKDFKPDKPTEKWGEPYNLNGAMVQKNEVTGQIRQAVNREPQIRVHQDAPITPVTIQDPKDPSKTIIVDGRSGKLIGVGPKLTQTGTLENKRQFNMQGIGGTIQSAEDLLTGKGGGNLPTGSSVGAAVDYVGGLVGKSPAGATEAAKLKSVGGALVSKMPRMEGPQSDRDVILYKEMAGKIGDSTVPRDQRIAALQTVKELWGKYEKINPDAFQGGGTQNPGQPRVVEW